jgi:hypothetical protein
VQVDDQRVHGKYMIAGKDGNYRKSKLEDIAALEKRQNITIISGPCLFSGSSMIAIDEIGQAHYINYPPHLEEITRPVTTIQFDSNLQPYEADAIMRFEEMMKLFDTSQNVTLALNVPRVEYYCYLLHLYEKGLVDQKTLFNYFDAVDQRSQGIERLMLKRVPPGINVTRINPLDTVEALIREGIVCNDRKLFDSVLTKLSQDNVYRQAIKRNKPQNFRDLSQLSYSLAHLQLAREKNTTLVVLENPEEIPSFHETANLLPGIVSHAQLIGLYSHPKVLVPSLKESVIGKSYLYFYKDRGRRILRDIIKANR